MQQWCKQTIDFQAILVFMFLCFPVISLNFPPPSLSQSLLEKRLHQEDGSVLGCSPRLLDQIQVVSSGCDLVTLQLLRIRVLAGVRPESGRKRCNDL